MKISSIYSNLPEIFPRIDFNLDSLNVIFGEVKYPKNLEKDCHNLGKTLLISLIEFLLLKDFGEEHFLKKNYLKFVDMIFYIEIKLNDGNFLTVKRGVSNNSKICFCKHTERFQDFNNILRWDHVDVPIEKSKQILDSYLDFLSIGQWGYRKGVSYFLRGQSDYHDVFQIQKFMKGKNEDWKPYMSRILGFDDSLIKEKYELDKLIDKFLDELNILQSETSVKFEDYDKLSGLIKIRDNEIRENQKLIDSFNFYDEEINSGKDLVDNIEAEVSQISNDIYNIEFEIKKINESLSEKLKFNLDDVKKIFEESKIYFNDIMVKDYEELVKFNNKVFSERRKHLKQRLEFLKSSLSEKNSSLNILNKKRSELLSFIREEDTFKKFRQIQNKIVNEKSKLAVLKIKIENLDKIRKIKSEVDKLEGKRQIVVKEIDENIVSGNETYEEIRKSFDHIIKEILGKHAMISVKLNKEGNLEFGADIISDEENLSTTNEGYGTSWRKILCVAFDLSVLRAYSKKSFFRFVYHDGIMEGLDNRKKRKLLDIIREYIRDYKIQYVLTLIDSDIPRDDTENKIYFDKKEIIRTLSDIGDSGRLFKMPKF